jgi:iron complex transport system ATP-binding protein
VKLVLDGVTAGYGGDPAVRDAALVVADGEFVALVGPNGSGKSTLLKTLYRALRPAGGSVVLGEDDLWRVPHRHVARTVGVLGQDPGGGFDFTARESVALGRDPHRGPFDRPGREDARIVADALDRAGCAHLADRALSTLSGGERQRVLIARALAQQPRVLVLDEPTNHLDPEHQIGVLRLAASLGVTVLAALHSLDLAAQYADTVVVLHGSRIVARGAPADVLVPDVLRTWFRVDGHVLTDPVTGRHRVLLRDLGTGAPPGR